MPASLVDSRLPTELDERTLARAMARDEQAFSELVRTYERRVYGLVVRMLGNATDAEDATHEVFIQVFKAIQTFRGDSKFSTWLYRIAVNHCKNRIKHARARHAEKQDAFEDAGENVSMTEARRTTFSTVERPDEAFAAREVETIVRESIQQIDPQFRDCLILRDVEELSYEEIGQILGLQEGTVKSRIHRARAQLRELVEARLGEKIR